MSERLLVSPGPVLDALSKEIEFRLDHYPTMVMNREKIESFFNKIQLLFNGGYRSVRFHTAKLNSCITLFCKCILIFIKDATDVKQEEKIDNIRRWLLALDNIGDLDSIKNKFTYFVPILRDSMFIKAPEWFIKEFLFHLNRVFEKANQVAVFTKSELRFFHTTIAKWLKLIMTCGDYEFQAIVVKCIVNICEGDQIEYVFKQMLSESIPFLRLFLTVHGKKDYINDVQLLLSSVNDSFKKVHSVPCLKLILQETVIPPLRGMNDDVVWMHINYVFHTFAFSCHRDSLRRLPGSDAYASVDEFVAIKFEDVDDVYFLINNDSKVNNSVGGIFSMTLKGQCSCRFNSSKEMVSSIKKIVVMVSVGTHLEFLKEEFTKLFGEKFKTDVQIPDKRRRSSSSKKGSASNSSQRSLSFRAENRRRMKKDTDSATSSPGSYLMRNLKLNNSLTLENKESVLEDTKDCFLISTGMRSNKPVVNENKEKKLINNKENIADCFERKEDKSIIKSKGTNDTKSNVSLKGNSKNKVNVENLQHDFSISPDTTTHLENESDSIIAPHFTKKLLTAKQDKMRQDTTERNSLILKNSDVDNLTTFQNEENTMSEDSEIFHNTTIQVEVEPMEIPSVNNSDKDCNILILEENRESVIDYINSELLNISDLNAYGKENNSPCKVIDMKHQKRNFGIVDSSLISVNSSVSKSIFKAKSDALDLDVTFDSPKIVEIRRKKAEQEDVPKITTKRKENVKNSLKHLPRNLPDIKNKVQTRRSLRTKLKIPDSCTLQKADKIVGGKANKNKSLNTRVGIRKQKAPTKIDHSATIENTKQVYEKVARDLEVLTNGQIAEESEYYSFMPDNAPTEDNTESNQMNNYSETLGLQLENNYSLKQLNNMNTEEMGNVDIVKVERPENDNLLTLDSQTVNATESEYYSFMPDNAPTEDNTESNQMNNYSETLGLLEKNYSLKQLINMNTDEMGNVEFVKVERPENDNLLTLDSQTVNVAVSEFYSCYPDITSTENNEISNGNFNADSNASIATPHIGTSKDEEIIENNTEQLIEYDESENLKLTVQQVNSVEESEDFLNAYCQASNQQNSETPDIDFILASRSNIVSPSVYNKNVNPNISTTLEKELVKGDHNHSYTLKNTKDQLSIKGNRRGKSIMKPCRKKRRTKAKKTLKNASNENTNEEASITNIRLSTETVKLYQSNDDNISVISISSDEEIYPVVAWYGSIKNVIQDVQILPSEIIDNYQIVNNSIADQQIEIKLDEDVTKTNEDIMNIQISNVMQEAREEQYEIDDHLNIISTFSNEQNVLGTEFEQIEDGSIAEEKIENDIAETNEDLKVKIECDIVKNDADIERIKNDHYYLSDRTSSHEIKTEILNDEDDVSNKGGPGSISDTRISVSKEINEFDTGNFDSELTQLTDVPILLKENVELRKESSKILENDVVDLEKANSDVSLMHLLNKHPQDLNKSNSSMKDLKNSCTLMKYKNMEHVSNKVSCELDDLTNAPVALNKITVLSNIRIAPPFNREVNQYQNEDQLEKEENHQIVDELPKTIAKVDCAMQQAEELELSPNLQTNQVNKKKSVKEMRKKLTLKHEILHSQDNLETSKERSHEINSVQEFIESGDKKTESNLKKLENPRYWPTKKFLLNKFNTSQERTKTALKTITYLESDFEMFVTRIEKSNSPELELKLDILSPPKSLFDEIATNEKKNAKQVTHKLQKPKEVTSFEEFMSFVSNKSPLNNSAEENKIKLSQNGDRSDFQKLKVQKKKMEDCKEFPLTLQSKKRLLDEAVPSITQKRRKLTGDVQLRHKIHQAKEDNFEMLTPEKSQFNKFNEHETSTPYVISTQKMQEFDDSDWEGIERVEEDNSEMLTPEKIPFEKFNESKALSPHVKLTQKIQKSKGSDTQLMEGAKEDSFEMLSLEKSQFKKFIESKTSTPRVELTHAIQKSKVSDWELIERVNENNCEMLTPKKKQLKKIHERTKSTPYVKSTQKMQTSKVSDWEMIERVKEDHFKTLTPKRLRFEKFNENQKLTPNVESTQKIQKSKVSDWEMMETDKFVPYQFKEFAPICKIPKKSVAASKSEKKKLIEVQPTQKMRKSENIDQDVNLIQQYESIINQAQFDRGDRDKVQSFSTKQKSKQNCYEKLPVINEEEFGLPRMNSNASGNEWNKNTDFDWDDFNIGKENNERLYQILNHPRKVYTICEKTGEALKFGKPIAYKCKKDQNDEEFYKVADSIYGFDAMQFALQSYLKTCELAQKKKKPRKKRITKMKLYTPKKAKSKLEKKKYAKVL